MPDLSRLSPISHLISVTFLGSEKVLFWLAQVNTSVRFKFHESQALQRPRMHRYAAQRHIYHPGKGGKDLLLICYSWQLEEN